MERMGKGVAIWVVGVFLLSACEKDISMVGSGEMVGVVFSVNTGGFGVDQVVTRGAGEEEGETTFVPLGDDFVVSATVRADTAEGLGAGGLRALTEGQLITIAAFRNGNTTTPEVTGNYVVTSGALLPDDPDAALRVEMGGAYYFVAYSYNSTSEYPELSNIATTNDLVWGKSVLTTITMKDQSVGIAMAHLFVRVRARIAVDDVEGASITGLGSVRFTSASIVRRVNLSLWSGEITTAGSSDLTLPQTNNFPTTEFFTDARPMVPMAGGAGNTNIAGLTLEVDGEDDPYAFPTFAVNFGTPMSSAGTSYVLDLNVKRNRWAGSNVYLNGNKLSFVKLSGIQVNYIAVFFKWGSLIGISRNGAAVVVGTNQPGLADLPNVEIYVPSGDGWEKRTIGSTSNSWGTTYASIPSVTGDITSSTSANYLYDNVSDTYLGDICKKIDPAWRMPNMAEFISGSYGAYSNGRKGSFSFGLVTFQASGNRDTRGLYYNSTLNYWTGSPNGSTAWLWSAGTTASAPFNVGTAGNRQEAFAVRCLKVNP
jgi:hypothetical protein